jgi:hypothetical protein
MTGIYRIPAPDFIRPYRFVQSAPAFLPLPFARLLCRLPVLRLSDFLLRR